MVREKVWLHRLSAFPWVRDLALSAGFWLLVSLPDVARLLVRGESATGPYEGFFFYEVLLEHYVWIPLTPLVFALARRVPFRRERLSRIATFHVLGGLALIAAHSMSLLAAQYALGYPHLRQASLRHLATHLTYPLPSSFLLYVPLLGVGVGVDYYRRFREAEEEARRLELDRSRLESSLARARLDLLTRQLQPHFLFNSLNAVSGLMESEPGRARRMIARLSDLLRLSLRDADRARVTLREEVRLLEAYLDIERIRFESRLRARIDVDGEVSDALVPPMLLQPIVENAVRHGIALDDGGGEVRVAARRVRDRLRILVSNDGPPVTGEVSEGVGLRNTRARLAEAYGEAPELALEAAPGGGVRVRIDLPLERAGRDG